MASKKRGKLSAREYAAKQSGGKLNYKTGKISVPTKSSSKSSSISSSSRSTAADPSGGSGEIFVNGQGYSVAPEKQSAFLQQQGIRQNPLTQEYEYIDTKKMFDKPKVSGGSKSSGSSSGSSSQGMSISPSNISQRANAANAFNVPSPFIPQGGISQAHPQSNQYQPDNTPISPNNGTVQRLPGRGYFSTGFAGNGSGDYGLNGGFADSSAIGADMTNPMDELMTILGLKTPIAQAETTQNPNPFNIANPFQQMNLPMSSMSNITPDAMQVAGLSYNPNARKSTGNPTIQSQPTYTPAPAQTAPAQNGVQDQGNQMLSGYDKQYKMQQKSMKAQEKAQKKALEELLKSIGSQYETDKTSGTTDLDKAKQEDLLRLSGLFSFANSDPNDEQRIQYQGRTTNDYASRLTDFLAKLDQNRGQQVSSAKQNYQANISDLAGKNSTLLQGIMDKRSQLQMDLAKMAQEMKIKQMGGGGSTSAGSQTYVGDNAKGEPVYYNSKTGAYTTQEGLTRKNSDPWASVLGNMFGGEQGNQQGQYYQHSDGLYYNYPE